MTEQVLAKVRRRPPEATEGEDAPVAPPVAGESEVLGELRRIRELLEGGRTA